MANKRREEIKPVLNDHAGGQTRLTMVIEMETAASAPPGRPDSQIEMESRIAEEAARREAAKRRKEYEVTQGAIAKELGGERSTRYQRGRS